MSGKRQYPAAFEQDNPDQDLMTVAMLPPSLSASSAKQEREDETREEETTEAKSERCSAV